MKKCTFGELMEKEVINTCDCRRLGNVSDLIIDLECGQIIALIVSPETQFFCFGKNGEKSITIPFECIKKIGDDIILTDMVLSPPPPKPPKHDKPKKLFFSE